MKFETTKEFALALDQKDPLAPFRNDFLIGGHTTQFKFSTYFSGHSLGLSPKKAKEFMEIELEDWARFGVLGHEKARNPWIPYHELLAEGSAHIVGAKESEVVVMNSLTVNLHLMMVSFYQPHSTRYKIVIEAGSFPSDRYAVVSQIRYHGLDPETSLIEISPRKGEFIVRDEDFHELLEKEGKEIALILLGGVNYYTGQVIPMEALTRKARKLGITVGLDLAHAAGNIPLSIHDWNVDFAIWCSYKYLNSGPGGPGGCFIHERHHKRTDLPRFAGWWGHDKSQRFQMDHDFIPIPTAEAWQLSNPSIFALAPLRASTELFLKAKMENLRAKSVLLTGYLEYLIRQSGLDDIEIITPKEPENRGAMLSLFISKNGSAIYKHLHDHGIVCDWREPNVIRMAPVPFYNRFIDIFQFYEVLQIFKNER